MDFYTYIDRKYAVDKEKLPKRTQFEVYLHQISPSVRNALFISEEPTLWNEERYTEYGIHLPVEIESTYEPSEIITKAKVGPGRKKLNRKDITYSEMIESQRASFLTFLSDISQEDPNYLRYLIYALERNIFLNRNSISTVRTLLMLSKPRKFPSYSSECAQLMAVAALKSKNPKAFKLLPLYKIHPELMFRLKLAFEQEFNATDLIFLANSAGYELSSHLMDNLEGFEENLETTILETYDRLTIKFEQDESLETDESIVISLMNPSLPIKEFKLMNLLCHPTFKSAIFSLLEQAALMPLDYENKSRRKQLVRMLEARPKHLYIPNDNVTLEERLKQIKGVRNFKTTVEIATGRDYYLRERYEQAEKHLLRAVRKNSKSFKLYLYLSDMYKTQNRYKDAADILQLGLKQLPKHLELDNQLRLINRLLRDEKYKGRASARRA